MSSGTGHFIAQRVSAVVLAVLGCWFAVAIVGLDSLTFLDAQRFVADRINASLLAALIATMAFHSWLGIEMVLQDYIHTNRLLRASLTLSSVAHVGFAIAAIIAIYLIGSGA